jgi:hypothetical protein
MLLNLCRDFVPRNWLQFQKKRKGLSFWYPSVEVSTIYVCVENITACGIPMIISR